MGLNAEMPGDQRADDALSVCFDGAALAEQLDLMGAAVLRLRVASDKPLAFLVARLCDVAPDGSSVRIAHGMLNLCHRASRETPEPMVPGRAEEVEIVLDQMAYRLAPGHHLRLALSTTYWPFVWPSPEAATVTVLEGALDLPVHTGSGAEWAPPEPEGATPWRKKVLRQGKAERRVETDLLSGQVTLVVADDLGRVENLSHGLVVEEEMREEWSVHRDDPLSAEVDIRWEQRQSRGDWSVRTEAETRMTCTPAELRMQAALRAWEGEAKVFERVWDEVVPRRFV